MEIVRSNVWGHRIPSLDKIIRDTKLKPLIEKFLITVADLLGLSGRDSQEFINLVFAFEEDSAGGAFAFEELLKRRIFSRCDRSKMGASIRARSSMIFDEIEEFLTGETLLDVGCGNGLVSEMAARH